MAARVNIENADLARKQKKKKSKQGFLSKTIHFKYYIFCKQILKLQQPTIKHGAH